MADEKELQLAQMFALRDGLEEKKEEERTDAQLQTGELLPKEEVKTAESKNKELEQDNQDPWSGTGNTGEETQNRKQKLSSIQFLFPKGGARKNKENVSKTVEPITTECEEGDCEEYGATQLLDDEEKEECSYKLIAIDSGQEVFINKPVFLIGCQKSACDMVIPQDVKTHVVSRRHAYILLKNDKSYIKDISSNGTFIGIEGMNDKDYYKLPKDTEVELKDRQIIKLANIKLMFLFNK